VDSTAHCVENGQVFQNGILLRILGPKSEELTGGWRWLQIFFTTYYYDDHIEDEMSGACNTNGRHEKCIQNVGQKA
jgi:hypothetical protein